MGRAFRHRPGRDHGGDQRLHRLRPQARRPGHRRLARPCRDARRPGRRRAGRRRRHRRRLEASQGRNRGGDLRLLARARGHSHECREPPRRHRRPGRGPAAHRALAQRPDRRRLQAVGARHDRRARRPDRRSATGARRRARSNAPTWSMPGFTHLQSAQPVTFGHHLLAYVEMLARDRGRFADARRAAQRMPARRGGARRHVVPDRPLHDGEGARLRPADRQFARQRRRPRLRARDARRGGDLRDASVAPGRGDRAVDDAAVRLRQAVRRVLDRLVDHAAEAQPRRRRAGARQDRAASSAR